MTNSFGVNGAYRYKPDISFTGFYQNSVTQFLDEGGTEVLSYYRRPRNLQLAARS